MPSPVDYFQFALIHGPSIPGSYAILLFTASEIIIQARLHQYVNHELPDVQAGFRKSRGNRYNCQHLVDHQKSMRVPERHLFCFIDYAKVFDCVDHNKLWKILKEMGIPEHLTCLLRNLYAGQESSVRTGHATIDWFQIENGVH